MVRRRIGVGGFLGLMLWLSLGRDSAAQQPWISVGPAPLGYQQGSPGLYNSGRVASIAVDPTDLVTG